MNKKKHSGLSVLLFLGITGIAFASFISSCGKSGNNNATTFNIQYQVVNLSPDLGPVSLYINYLVYNNYTFYYPAPSGYFALSSIDTPFQIRHSVGLNSTAVVPLGNIFSVDHILKPNFKYTLFIGGLANNATVGLDTVFLTDTANLPAIGRGKVRFLNFSPLSTGFDVYANGVLDSAKNFTNIKYTKVSKFIQLPAGNYTFQVYPTGTNGATSGGAGAIGSLQNLTVQDGRAYTIYSYGIVGHTDSTAFGLGAIVNR